MDPDFNQFSLHLIEYTHKTLIKNPEHFIIMYK